MDIPLTDIPEHSSLVLELKADEKELDAIFGELTEFSVHKPESFEASLRMQKMGDTFRLSGEVWVELAFECGRCLTPRTVDAHGELEYMIVSQEKYVATYQQDTEVELTLADLDVDFFQGEEIDLRPFLREAIILALPHTPTCAFVDAQEACDEAFERLVPDSQKEEEHQEDAIDPRWAPLMALKSKVTDNEDN